MNRHKFLFISGLHRSGTTLLAQCLREHPEISGFRDTGVSEDEGQFLQTVYAPGVEHGGPGKLAFDPATHLTEDSPLITEENRRKLFTDWARYWDLERPVLLEKSPPNLM